MTEQFVQSLILQLPNWAGFILLYFTMSKTVSRLLDIIDDKDAEIERLKNSQITRKTAQM